MSTKTQNKKVIKVKVSEDHYRKKNRGQKVVDGVGSTIYYDQVDLCPTLFDWVGDAGYPLPDDVNPRSHGTEKINRNKVSKSIRSTLNGEEGENPSLFHLKNRGIVILCKESRYDKNTETLSIVMDNYEGDDCTHGCCDGGTTDSVINKFQKEIAEDISDELGKDITFPELTKMNCSDLRIQRLKDIRVPIKLIVGLKDRALIKEISEGLNTSIAVKEGSFVDWGGGYQWIKDSLDKNIPNLNVAYDQNADGDVEIEKILCILNLLHPDYIDGKKHPTVSYSGKNTVFNKLKIEIDKPHVQKGFEALQPILCDTLKLHDHIWSNMHNYLKGLGHKAGKIQTDSGDKPFVSKVNKDKNRKKGKVMPFTGCTPFYQYKAGANVFIYPILSSLRAIMDVKNGRACWNVDDPFSFLDANDYENGKMIATKVYEAFKNADSKNINAFGKNSGPYSLAFSASSNGYMKIELEELRKTVAMTSQ